MTWTFLREPTSNHSAVSAPPLVDIMKHYRCNWHWTQTVHCFSFSIYADIYLILLCDHSACSILCRYVRTDSCFWDFSWELRGTGLTSSLPACPHPPGLTRATSLKVTPTDPALTPQHFFLPFTHHAPKSGIVRPACSLCFPEQRWGQGHWVVSHFASLHECMCMWVCVPLRLRMFHTHHLRGKNECWWYCFRCKEWTFLFHNYLQLQEICILTTEQHCSFWGPDTVWCCIQLFCHHSAITNCCWEFWIRVANSFWHFDGLMFPSNIFLRFSFRSLKLPWASLRKQHEHL